MKIYIHRFLFHILLGTGLFCTSTVSGQKIKSVKKLPIAYEYPVDSFTSVIGTASEKPWIVYSDRNNNVSYTDSKIRTTLKSLTFLESFYVTDETSELVEIIKYEPDMLEANSIKIKTPSKVQYYGWIQKSKLLLSQKSFVENMDKRPLKWVTMLSGKKIIDKVRNYADGERLKLFDAPELQTTLNKSLYFNELVYVYKTYGDKVLIGKQTHFNPASSTDVILGWVPSGFVQAWGQRLCLEPLKDQSNKNNTLLIYTSKDWALAGNNTGTFFPVELPSCEKAYNWKKYPVFKIEEINKNKTPYKLFHTGAVTSAFDKTNSFIYNVNGSKINYSALCDISRSASNVNIVVAINAGSDTREYLYALTNVVQELNNLFISDKRDLQYRFAAVDCASNTKTEFAMQYSTILPTLISIAQKSVEGKASTVNNGIGNGLSTAGSLFKGHENETNIVIVISSKADTDTRALRDALYSDLGQKNVRLLFLQPYCGTDQVYSDFTTQSKTILENTANKIATLKRNKVANTTYAVDRSKLKTFLTGENNVYCLDFPANASTQGFLVFPTVNNKIDSRYLNVSMDSLLNQITTDNTMMVSSLQSVFNSSSSFNNSVNQTFQKYYKTQDSLPADLGFSLNNVDYNYFINGYTAYPSSIKPFKLSLLLTTEEYEDIYNMFKGLKLDQINDQYDLKSRTLVYQEFSKLLTNYNIEHYISIPIYNLSFSDYFYKLFGFYSDNELLNKYKVYDLNSPNIIGKEDLKKMIDYMNQRIGSFYKLRNDNRVMFVSNGNSYYWISEDFLP